MKRDCMTLQDILPGDAIRKYNEVWRDGAKVGEITLNTWRALRRRGLWRECPPEWYAATEAAEEASFDEWMASLKAVKEPPAAPPNNDVATRKVV